jgi:ribonuclease G
MRKILINIEPYEKRVAIINKGVIEEFNVERTDQARLAGNIYKGVIASVVPGIGAVFVDIGTGKNGFLYIEGREEKTFQSLFGEEIVIEKRSQRGRGWHARFRKGQEFLVEVVKEPIGTKGPLLTTDISLPGKYLVLMPFNDTVGISKRIENRQERAKIKNILESVSLPKGVGCIARTQSLSANPRDLKLEISYLLGLWSRIMSRAEKIKAPSLIYEEYDLPLRVIRDYFEGDIEEIFVDSREEYQKISRFAQSIQPKLRKKIFYYRGRTSLYERYGIENRIEDIFRRKVFLKSGGSIVIEQTESLVAIDVNTGKYTGRRNLEETAFNTNMEAAEEIARQLMLRDIGGIVIIDFIDMNDRSHRKRMCDKLEDSFKRDKAKTNILNVSSIGVVEMTRQRVRKSLESVSFRDCPYCNGMGRVKTPATIAIEAVRRLRRSMREQRSREVVIISHPDVADYMKGQFSDVMRSMERKFRKQITVKSDARLHVEDVHFE